MARPRLAVLGYASIDEIDSPGADPGVSIGGGAIYAALAAARLGVEVVLHVSFGNDFPPDWIAELQRLGIDLSATQQGGHPTRRTRLSYLRDEQRRASTERDAAWLCATDALQPPLPSGRFDGVLICPMPLTLVGRTIAEVNGAYVAADTSEIFAAGGPAAMSAFNGVDLFAPSLAEVHLLTAESDETRAIARLAAAVPVLVVKKGRRGLSRIEGEEELHQPIHPIGAIDPTGAGDAAIGAMTAALLLGFEPRRQLDAAAQAGRLAVSARGPSALGWRA